MQPLDLNKIDAAIIAAVKNYDRDALCDVLEEITSRIQHATNPISNISAPLVVLALKAAAKAIDDQIPGANDMAKKFGHLIGFVSIKVPSPQKNQPPEP